MAETVVLTTQERKEHGTRFARRLRKKGLVPAVVYGHKEETEAVAVVGDELAKAIRHGVRVLDLKTGAKVQKTLIKDLQWDPLGHDILHVDFARVSADERVTLDVRIELRGTAPGVAAGGVVVQPLHSLHVECSVISVPDSIRVSIADLQLDQAIHVKDLKLPEGVTVKNDPDAIVVQVSPKEVEAEAAVPGAGETAEPEVIGRVKEEEEAEEKE